MQFVETIPSGDIDMDRGFTLHGSSTCPGSMDFVIPSGQVIDSVHTSYDMTAGGGAWKNEQTSMLFSPTLSVGEGTLATGKDLQVALKVILEQPQLLMVLLVP